MRCNNLDEPCGSHHVDARALKCETSSGLTLESAPEPVLWKRNWFCTNRGAVRRRRLRFRIDVGRSGEVVVIAIADVPPKPKRRCFSNSDPDVVLCELLTTRFTRSP